jgi:transposase
MKGSRFSGEQIIGILREQEVGATTADVCRKHGISEATFLQMEGQIRRPRSVGRQAAEDARGRERKAEETVGSGDAGWISPF